MIIRIMLILCILSLLGFGALWLIKRAVGRWLKTAFKVPTPPQQPLEEKLVQCEVCHTFIPFSQAITKTSKHCCQTCQQR